MQWLEVTLRVPREQSEAIADILQAFGSQGVSIEHEGIPPDRYDDDEVPPPPVVAVRVYLNHDDTIDRAKADIEAQFAQLHLSPVYQIVDDTNWADAWKAHYHPVRIGRKIVIRPLWEEAQDTQPDDIIIALDPGMAFGTGTHPTTQLCLASLEDMVEPNASVLDLGCGSGILAIAAAKLNAGEIIAIDIDSVAVAATLENAEINGVGGQIVAQQGGLETALTAGRQYDLLVANILARIIIEMCGQNLVDLVRPGGKAIFSGIILEQVSDVESALSDAGLTLTGVRREGDWVSMEAFRPLN